MTDLMPKGKFKLARGACPASRSLLRRAWPPARIRLPPRSRELTEAGRRAVDRAGDVLLARRLVAHLPLRCGHTGDCAWRAAHRAADGSLVRRPVACLA